MKTTVPDCYHLWIFSLVQWKQLLVHQLGHKNGQLRFSYWLLLAVTLTSERKSSAILEMQGNRQIKGQVISWTSEALERLEFQ